MGSGSQYVAVPVEDAMVVEEVVPSKAPKEESAKHPLGRVCLRLLVTTLFAAIVATGIAYAVDPVGVTSFFSHHGCHRHGHRPHRPHNHDGPWPNPHSHDHSGPWHPHPHNHDGPWHPHHHNHDGPWHPRHHNHDGPWHPHHHPHKHDGPWHPQCPCLPPPPPHRRRDFPPPPCPCPPPGEEPWNAWAAEEPPVAVEPMIEQNMEEAVYEETQEIEESFEEWHMPSVVVKKVATPPQEPVPVVAVYHLRGSGSSSSSLSDSSSDSVEVPPESSSSSSSGSWDSIDEVEELDIIRQEPVLEEDMMQDQAGKEYEEGEYGSEDENEGISIENVHLQDSVVSMEMERAEAIEPVDP